ncbi:hypothetical protein O71_08460 [Pontibacter sp. BAB1700]|nr:hypothetical protein O71_08460 [Pontibacter sp. BAB1700]
MRLACSAYAIPLVLLKGILFVLTSGYTVSSAGGFPMDGKSVSLTYVVEDTVEGFLKGEDTILNYTLQLIHQKPVL